MAEEPKAKTLLIADDDADLAALLRRRYEAKGYRVFVAPDGLQAGILARDVKPDLIIVDVQMPGAHGGMAAARLKAMPETRGVPIFFLSGLKREDAEWMLPTSGKTQFFSKKEPLEKLDAAVDAVLGGTP